MKFIHLSDLHIGKKVNGFSMLEDQAYILNHILEIIASEQPDAVLIAGDVYDIPTPSGEAVTLMSSFIRRLHNIVRQVFIIAGNHDSAERLAFGTGIMDEAGIHFSPIYSADMPVTILEDEYGPIGIYMLPFVKPADVRDALRDTPLGKRSTNTYTEALEAAVAQMAPDTTIRNVLVAHQMISGSYTSDSEDMLAIGGVQSVDACVFQPFDYVALGHLHRPQMVGKSGKVRYAGSPLKYSFSEVSNQKSVSVVVLGKKGEITVREVPLTPLHEWVDLRGEYSELMQHSYYANKGYEEAYTRITLTNELPEHEAFAKLREVYHRLMEFQYDNTSTRQGNTVEIEANEATKRTPMDNVSELYMLQNGQGLTDEQKRLVTKLVEEIFG